MMKRFRPFLALVLSLAAVSTAPRPTQAFGGEDFTSTDITKWHHAHISQTAAEKAKMSKEAALSIAWHADAVDSYGYNPIWWGKGVAKNGFTRFKAAMSAHAELTKVHFDDLYTMQANSQLPGRGIDKAPRNPVELQMRRYLSGTLAGLMYAAENNDVAMAHHILGVSLHALQDFYSHSNWVDEGDRQKATYFDMASNGTTWKAMGSLTLFTGSYETDEHLGIKDHGRYSIIGSALNLPGVGKVMEYGCGSLSPISNSDTCKDYKNALKGKSPEGAKVEGVYIPKGVIYMAPAGINLDSTWLAEIGARERNLVKPGFTAQNAFNIAKSTAVRASEQWLLRLGTAMTQVGKGAFWKQVTTVGTVDSFEFGTSKDGKNLGLAQWEDFGKLGYQFVSAGSYPPKAGDPVEEFFLRVKIKTSNAQYAGTDADIRAVVEGTKIRQVVKNPATGKDMISNKRTFLLDNMPSKNEGNFRKVIGYNDFEAGDDDVYLIGPLNAMPDTITLENRSATGWEVVKELAKDIWEGIENTVRSIVDSVVEGFKSLFGSHADFVAQNKQVWRFDKLPKTVGQTEPFSLRLRDPNKGKEGDYTLHGTIRKTADVPGQGPGDAEYVVRLTDLKCEKESDVDRLGTDDEPFLAVLLNPLGGKTQKKLLGPYEGVDTGETVKVNYEFTPVRIPKEVGVLTLPVMVMESDDESAKDRQKILDTFDSNFETYIEHKNHDFMAALGSAIAADWKVDSMEVWGFSKGDTVRSARVGNFTNIGWIEGNAERKFTLSPLPSTAVRAEQLEDMTGVVATQAIINTPLKTASMATGALGLVTMMGLGILRGRRKG